MPIIPFFPNFPRFVNTGGRRRRRRDYKAQYSNLRSTNSQGLELLGSTCQSQVSTPVSLGAGQYLPQTYTHQPQPQAPAMQYTGSQFSGSQYTQSQPTSPYVATTQRPMSAPHPAQPDSYMLPSLQQQSPIAMNAGYQLPNQPALSTAGLYQPMQATSMYQPQVVTPIVPSSNNYLPYSTPGHGHSLSLTSNPNIFDQKSDPRSLLQPLSAGRALSTLGAIPPSGLSFFGMTPAQQAFFQQRQLPPPPPPQPRVYSFENSTQTTIAETLQTAKDNKEKRANSPRQRSEGPTSQPLHHHQPLPVMGRA